MLENITIKIVEGKENSFNLIIIDNIRSGTHETYNVIYNNFCCREYLNSIEEVKDKINEQLFKL